jgi:hypothetical protein
MLSCFNHLHSQTFKICESRKRWMDSHLVKKTKCFPVSTIFWRARLRQIPGSASAHQGGDPRYGSGEQGYQGQAGSPSYHDNPNYNNTALPAYKDGNFTQWYGYPWVSYPYGQCMGILLYPWVIPTPYPLSHGQGMGIALYPWVYPYPTR